MSRRHMVFVRPEGGAERDVLWVVNHHCSDYFVKMAVEGEADDEVVFPVGLSGWEMPMGVPFEVQAANPCGSCGKLLKMWAEWRKQLVLV